MNSPLQHAKTLQCLAEEHSKAWVGSIAPGDAQETLALPEQEKTTYGLVKEG